MSPDDYGRRDAGNLGERYEVLVFDGEDFAADHAGDAGPSGDGDRYDDGHESGSEYGDDNHGEQDGREAHSGVGYAHDDGVHPLAGVAGYESQHGSDDDAGAEREHTDEGGGAGAVNQAAEDVLAGEVGSERVIP